MVKVWTWDDVTFILDKDIMIQSQPFAALIGQHRYFMTRDELYKGFRDWEEREAYLRQIGNGEGMTSRAEVPYHVSNDRNSYRCSFGYSMIGRRKHLGIGCQTFDPENAAKLREWASGERKKTKTRSKQNGATRGKSTRATAKRKHRS